MVWTVSQDYSADEILYTARTVLFDKINRLIREIIILFEVPRCSFGFTKMDSGEVAGIKARL
jgi:hypothetical protein